MTLVVSCLWGEAPDTRSTCDPVLFFYSKTCVQCKQMKEIINLIVSENKDVKIELHDADEEPELWENTCSAYGIPAWGVPRIFIGSKVFAGWFQYVGELVYEPSYYGYIGSRNQIVKALEQYFNCSISNTETEEIKRNQSSQVGDDDCNC